jgi:hypothetical protein
MKPPYTSRQGQFLAFSHHYTTLHGRPPAEAEMAHFFRVTPPSVHHFSLNSSRRFRIVINVKSLRTVITLVVLAVWPLAVVHCKLETIPGLEFLRCAADTPTSSDCQGDGCETVESALYKVPDQQNITPEPVFETVMLSSLMERVRRPCENHSSWLVTCAPPELPKVWQFSFRTALPPRAPSIVS